MKSENKQTRHRTPSRKTQRRRTSKNSGRPAEVRFRQKMLFLDKIPL